jgi:hypothetical protein
VTYVPQPPVAVFPPAPTFITYEPAGDEMVPVITLPPPPPPPRSVPPCPPPATTKYSIEVTPLGTVQVVAAAVEVNETTQ